MRTPVKRLVRNAEHSRGVVRHGRDLSRRRLSINSHEMKPQELTYKTVAVTTNVHYRSDCADKLLQVE